MMIFYLDGFCMIEQVNETNRAIISLRFCVHYRNKSSFSLITFISRVKGFARIIAIKYRTWAKHLVCCRKWIFDSRETRECSFFSFFEVLINIMK